MVAVSVLPRHRPFLKPKYGVAEEEKTKLRLEIAHVLFMDIVGYSKLLNDEQRESLHELNQIVRSTESVQEAEAAGQLIRLPTGDGMALVFTSSVEAPVECALQISGKLRAKPSLPLRMGIHSGAVQHVEDVNERINIAGAGINIAQRVMDCGDAGHILVSKRVADDLSNSRRWHPYLHDLGECAVKHGVIVSLVNLYADVVGNSVVPGKLAAANKSSPPVLTARLGRWLLLGTVALLVAVMLAVLLPRHAPVQTQPPAPATPAPTAVPMPPATTPDKSVAVLPFDNFSEDKESAFFAEGVQDEVLTDLARVADLKVISRSSVMQYNRAEGRNLREIGKILGVAYVVEGSVQRAGNKIRVTAQLINASTDTHKWAEKYDRDLADVFVVQSDIAQAIAGQLQAAISPQEHAAMMEVPTHDEEAYRLYLQASAIWDDFSQALPDPHKVLDLLQQATAHDPAFVRAYALMTEAACFEYFNLEHTPQAAEAARSFSETAAHVRPGSADANVAMGYYHYYVLEDFPRAREDFRAVVRESPNDARAYFCLGSIGRRQGLWDESVTNLRRACELDPARDIYIAVYLELLASLGRHLEAQAFLDNLLSMHPKQLWLRGEKAYLLLGWKADTRAARAELASLPPETDRNEMFVGIRFMCDEYDRDFTSAQRLLAAWPSATFDGSPRSLAEADLANWRGDTTAAKRSYQIARSAIETEVHSQPGNSDLLMTLAEVDASLGHKDVARAEGQRALAGARPGDTESLPKLKTIWLAVLARLGEREEAIHTLQELVGKPYGPEYGSLRSSRRWDSLRGDPRFEAIVKSQAPK